MNDLIKSIYGAYIMSKLFNAVLFVAALVYFLVGMGTMLSKNPGAVPYIIGTVLLSVPTILLLRWAIKTKWPVRPKALTREQIHTMLEKQRQLKAMRIEEWEARIKEGCNDEDCRVCPFAGDPCDEIDQERLRAQTWYDKHKEGGFKHVEVDFDYLWDIGVKF